ncbi:hypothetical protein C8J56DRAFT_885746 [Mycena floridula]|nr:hypothetical protein C8J56DRAFT_885746 [Mycena floridula]
MESMLCALLRLQNGGDTTKADQDFSALLKMTTTFCNAWDEEVSADCSLSRQLRKNLEDYRNQPDELQRYLPLVGVFNTAFQAFYNQFIDFLPPPSCDLENEILAKHNDESWDDCVKTAYNIAIGHPPDGYDPKHSPLTWKDPNTFVEVKKELDTLAALPNKFSSDRCPVSAIPPLPIEHQQTQNWTCESHPFEQKGGDSGSVQASGSHSLSHSATTASTRKRRDRSDDADRNTSNKKAKTSQNLFDRPVPPTLWPPVQAATYTVEHLASLPGLIHTIGLIVVDEKLYIWWYDRHSCIQTTGIDIITQLPHLVALLVLFQRLPARLWGCSGLIEESAKIRSVLVDGKRFEIREDHSTQYTLLGRGTVTVPVYDEKGKKYMLKTSFPDQSRLSEVAAVRKCMEIAGDDARILYHLPAIVASQDFPDSATSIIRDFLGIDHGALPTSRILRVIVSDWLEPITSLKGDQFWTAFWQIICCHHLLWRLGMHHGDINLTNLMYNAKTQCGVLNDFDLSTWHGRSSIQTEEYTRLDRSGSMHFMAMELLTNEGWNGEIPRYYRHELESFAWVFLYVSCHFLNGQACSSGPFEAVMRSRDHVACGDIKWRLYFSPLAAPMPDYATYATAANVMVKYWVNLEMKNRPWSLPGEVKEPEQSDDFHLRKILEEIQDTAHLGIPIDFSV